jgi:aminoglycoside 3-N-acetyltransferase
MHETKLREYRSLLCKLGVGQGDNIMLHADLRLFGKIEGGFNTIIDELLSIIGEEGTIVTPSFTFTFPYTFDLLKSHSKIGGLTNLFAKHPNVMRVPDGMTSYYIIGSRAHELIENWDNTSYGQHSIIGQMLKLDGSILQFDTEILSLIHYVEQEVGVPYRELKRFDGKICVENEIFNSFTNFYARVKNVKKIIPDPIRSKYYTEKAKKEFLNGRVTRSFKMKDFVDYAKVKLTKDKMLLVE